MRVWGWMKREGREIGWRDGRDGEREGDGMPLTRSGWRLRA